MTQWYLRNADGHTYGPVSLSTLQLWAADGRVAPDDHVSADRQQSWATASDVRDLSMNWIVETADGSRYGPVHLLALRDMLKEGHVDTGGMIEHRDTGERQKVGQALLPMLMKQNANLLEQIALLQVQIRDLESPSAAPSRDHAHQEASQKWKQLYDEEQQARRQVEDDLTERIRELQKGLMEVESARDDQVAQLQAKIEDLESQAKEQEHQLRRNTPDYHAQSDPLMREWKDTAQSKDTYQKEAQKWKQLYEEEQQSHQKIEDDLNTRIRELREGLMEAETARERMAFKLKQMERQSEAMEAANSGEGEDTGTAPAALLESYNNLSTNYDTLLQQLNEKSEELKTFMDTRDQAEQLAASRMKQLDELLQREREEADKARRRLTELEQAHLQLVRSYREMNDRFIRMRQSITENAPPKATPAGPGKETAPPDVPPEEPEKGETDPNVEAEKDAGGKDWQPKVRLT